MEIYPYKIFAGAIDERFESLLAIGTALPRTPEVFNVATQLS